MCDLVAYTSIDSILVGQQQMVRVLADVIAKQRLGKTFRKTPNWSPGNYT